MVYIYLVIGVIIAGLSGALWIEHSRANAKTEEVGRLIGKVAELGDKLREAKEIADNNRGLANFWRDETVRGGLLIAETEERASKIGTTIIQVIQEVSRASDAALPLPAAYELGHSRLRELAAARAGRPGAPGAGAGQGAAGHDGRPAAGPNPAAGRLQR